MAALSCQLQVKLCVPVKAVIQSHVSTPARTQLSSCNSLLHARIISSKRRAFRSRKTVGTVVMACANTAAADPAGATGEPGSLFSDARKAMSVVPDFLTSTVLRLRHILAAVVRAVFAPVGGLEAPEFDSRKLLLCAGPLFFASIRQSAPVNTPLTVIASGMAKWLELYSGLLLVRVLLTWFPNMSWEKQPLLAIKDMTDPYLSLFRNILPPFYNTIDLSPMLAFIVLGVLSNILNSTLS